MFCLINNNNEYVLWFVGYFIYATYCVATPYDTTPEFNWISGGATIPPLTAVATPQHIGIILKFGKRYGLFVCCSDFDMFTSERARDINIVGEGTRVVH